MIYLASPYSHPDPVVRERRYRAACSAAATLMKRGHQVFSPIAHGHVMAELGLPTCWAYWQDYDRHHLTHCDEVLVLMLSGWKESAGVQAEIRLARELRKPMSYVEPEELIYGTAPVAAGTE
jgi:hypothetical protein